MERIDKEMKGLSQHFSYMESLVGEPILLEKNEEMHPSLSELPAGTFLPAAILAEQEERDH